MIPITKRAEEVCADVGQQLLALKICSAPPRYLAALIHSQHGLAIGSKTPGCQIRGQLKVRAFPLVRRVPDTNRPILAIAYESLVIGQQRQAPDFIQMT